MEYSGEEQAICCVGLAKPKPNVFLSAIQHILVLATPVEVGCAGQAINRTTMPRGRISSKKIKKCYSLGAGDSWPAPGGSTYGNRFSIPAQLYTLVAAGSAYVHIL